MHRLIETLSRVKDWLVLSCFGDVCDSSMSVGVGTNGANSDASLDFSDVFGEIEFGDGSTKCMLSYETPKEEEEGPWSREQHAKEDQLLYGVIALLTQEVHYQSGLVPEQIPVQYKVLDRLLKYDPMLNSMHIRPCQSDGNFSDSQGFKCVDYDQETLMCQSASQRAVEGLDASSRCCACGAGMEQRALSRHSHAMASLGLDIYVHSGCADEVEDCLSLRDDFLVYETSRNEWFTLARGPTARYGHTLSCIWSDLFLFGGRNQAGISSELWRFSGKLWKMVDGSDMGGSPPSARYRHAAAVMASTLYIYGGQRQNGMELNDLYSLDATLVWRQLPSESSISGRHGHLMVSLGDKLHVIGGIPTARSGPELASYDPGERSWKSVAAPEERGFLPFTTNWRGLSGVEVGGRLLAFASWSDNLPSDIFRDDWYQSLSDSLFLPERPAWASVSCHGSPDEMCFGWFQSSGANRLYDVWAQRGPSLLVAPVDHKVFVGDSLALALNQLQFDQDLLVVEQQHAPLVNSGDPHPLTMSRLLSLISSTMLCVISSTIYNKSMSL